jgi:hypothetical protein
MSELEMDQLMMRLQCTNVVDEERLRQVLGGLMSSSSPSSSKIQEIEAVIEADDVFFDEQ